MNKKVVKTAVLVLSLSLIAAGTVGAYKSIAGLAPQMALAVPQTISSNFVDKDLTVGDGELGWTASISANSFESSNSSRGVQFGAAQGQFTLTSKIEFSRTVSKVAMTVSTNGDASKNTISVSVGSAAFHVENSDPEVTTYAMPKNNNYTVTFVGSATGSIIIGCNDSHKSVYFKQVVVTYEDGGQTVSSVGDVTGTMPASYTTLQSWNSQGLAATVTTSDSSAYTGDISYTFTPESPALVGETTEGSVSVKATAGGKTSTNAKVFSDLTIEQANVSDGLEATPTDGTQLKNVSVAGKISALGTYSNGSYTYYISDTGERSDEIQIYNGKFLEGANFTSASQLNVGDDVIVYGSLLYYNNTTYEFDAGSYILSHISNAPSISINGGNRNADISDENVVFTATTANIGENVVTWSSSDTSVAEINESTGAVALIGSGETSITASVIVNQIEYTDSVTLTVTAPIVAVGETVVFFNGTNYLTGLNGTIGTTGNEEDALVFTIEAGTAENSFAFNYEGDYIAYDSTEGGNSLHITKTKDASSSWTLEGTSKTAITAIKNVASSNRILRYNSSSPRFACYTSGQNAVSLKIKEIPADPTNVELSEHSLTLEQEQQETLTFVADSRQNAFKWYSSNESVAMVEDGVVTAGTTSGKANIIVYFDSNNNGSYDANDTPQDTCVVTVNQPTFDYSSVTFGGTGTKITSANSGTYLADGKKVIFAYNDTYTYGGFSSYLSTVPNSASFPLTFADSKVTIGDGTSQLSFMILELESTDGGFYLKMKDGKYLGHTSSSSSAGNLTQDENATKVWSITVDANGNATIYGGNDAKGNETRSYLRVNTGSSNRLKPYASGTGVQPTLYSFVEYTDEALAYAETFLKGNGSANTCAATIGNWTNLGTAYTNTLSSGAKNLFKNATHNDPETYVDPTEYTIQHAVARYDDALLKHSELRSNEFMEREAAGTLSYSAFMQNLMRSNDETSNIIPLVVTISLASLTAFGGAFFIKRRKEQ